jgi:hypothetical protein
VHTPARTKRRLDGRCVDFGTLTLLGLHALGCGTREHDTVPPELLAVLENVDDAPYPGPYGNQVGDIATNVCLRAWDDPVAAAYAEEALSERCLADYYDPEAAEVRLLLVNTSAVWCLACRTEYAGSADRPSLGEHARSRFDRGFRVLGVMFQDASRAPATVEVGVAWASAYEVDFAFGVDEAFVMGEFADSQVQPFNMLIDTRTMEIIAELEGDQPGALWPLVDELLDRE